MTGAGCRRRVEIVEKRTFRRPSSSSRMVRADGVAVTEIDGSQRERRAGSRAAGKGGGARAPAESATRGVRPRKGDSDGRCVRRGWTRGEPMRRRPPDQRGRRRDGPALGSRQRPAHAHPQRPHGRGGRGGLLARRHQSGQRRLRRNRAALESSRLLERSHAKPSTWLADESPTPRLPHNQLSRILARWPPARKRRLSRSP
jgi:hypothetical protein